MCVAIVVKKGNYLLDDTINKCWRANDDGGGFAYVKDGKVEIVKGLMTLDKFKEAYKSVAETSPSNMLVHFRIRTSGRLDADNTHPFRVKDGAMIHNGVICSPAGNKSDTRLMVDKWFNKLNKENLLLCNQQLGEAIGGGNKLAFLFNDDTYLITNEERGSWNKDGTCWFSNEWWRC